MNNRFQRTALGLTVLALMTVTGCSPKVARTVDVSQGEYYTAEEFKNLSKTQYDAYCAALAAELQKVESSKSTSSTEATNLRNQLAAIQGEVRTLQGQVDSRKASVDGVQKEIDYFEGLPKVHVVEKGEFLRKISAYDRIYADQTKWPRIYRANKDKIQDPNLIFPGWELVIPRDWPMSWTVKDGEYLGRIAGYWEVYGKRSDWPKLYEANKDKIKDPNLIHPDWQLTIPRD
jgi:nucleoid-associated protein YgaU